MKILWLVLLLILPVGCYFFFYRITVISKKIFGKNFTAEKIKHIEISITSPTQQSIVRTRRLSKKEQENFLKELKWVRCVGLVKCLPSHFVEINLTEEALQLKICGTLLSAHKTAIYYRHIWKKNWLKPYLP